MNASGDARDAQYCHTRQHPSEVGWGAPLYHAVPDCIAMRISVKSDIWMLAQTCIHLWLGRPPDINPMRPPLDLPIRKTVLMCVCHWGEDRPTANEVLKATREASIQPALSEGATKSSHSDNISKKAKGGEAEPEIGGDVAGQDRKRQRREGGGDRIN